MGAGGAAEWLNIPKEYKPHWSVWKVDGTALEEVQNKLARKGLKDPWIRNEVWKFQTCFKYQNMFRSFKAGLIPGFVIFAGLAGLERLYYPETTKSSHH